MRLFVALELPDDARGHLAAIVHRVRHDTFRGAAVSWVRPENLHVTMKFLGEVDEPTAAALANAMAALPAHPALQLTADRFECLPPRGPTRVIAAGVAGSIDVLAKLQLAVERACAAVGFPPEGRAFLPHITLGRVKGGPRRALANVLRNSDRANWPGPQMVLRAVTMMQSTLTPRGSEYAAVGRFTFAPNWRTESENPSRILLLPHPTRRYNRPYKH